MNCNTKWSIFYLFSWTFAIISVSLWISDPDIFWHLKVGEWIALNGAVPTTDTFSWSVYGESWTAHQWLWDLILYIIHENFGLLGIWGLTFLMGFISASFIRAGLKFRGASEGVATISGGLAVLLLVGWLKPWPQAGTYALFSGYLFMSLKNKWGFKEIIYCFVIGLVWGNIHSTAIMLPLLLLAEIFWKLIFKRNELKDVWWRFSAVIASGIATLINPHGIGLWQYAVNQGLLTQMYRENIISWAPYHFNISTLTLMFFISMIILFVAVKQGNEKELEFIRAIGFWILALMSRIYSPFALLSTAALVGKLNIELGLDAIKRMSILALTVGLIVLAIRGLPTDLNEVAMKGYYPVNAYEFIEEQGYEKIYNEHGWGGYLIWKGVPVYIDGRNDVYAELFDGYVNINKKEGPLSTIIKKTGAKTVLAHVNNVRDIALRESMWWIEMYRDDIAVVYIRR